MIHGSYGSWFELKPPQETMDIVSHILDGLWMTLGSSISGNDRDSIAGWFGGGGHLRVEPLSNAQSWRKKAKSEAPALAVVVLKPQRAPIQLRSPCQLCKIWGYTGFFSDTHICGVACQTLHQISFRHLNWMCDVPLWKDSLWLASSSNLALTDCQFTSDWQPEEQWEDWQPEDTRHIFNIRPFLGICHQRYSESPNMANNQNS